jgi:hypothetical protein
VACSILAMGRTGGRAAICPLQPLGLSLGLRRNSGPAFGARSIDDKILTTAEDLFVARPISTGTLGFSDGRSTRATIPRKMWPSCGLSKSHSPQLQLAGPDELCAGGNFRPALFCNPIDRRSNCFPLVAIFDPPDAP